MRLLRITFSVGVFFLLQNFTVVFLFDQLLAISKAYSMPTGELVQFQMTIMNILVYSLIGLGCLFFILIIGLIYNITMTKQSEINN